MDGREDMGSFIVALETMQVTWMRCICPESMLKEMLRSLYTYSTEETSGGVREEREKASHIITSSACR